MLDQIEDLLKNRPCQPLGKQRFFSVMLPLIQREGEWHILYEVRGTRISQPGETSFPGGAVEANESFEEAAVRETMEELNVEQSDIRVLGEIDYIVSEFAVIHCFVGVIDKPFDSIQFSKAEVASIFTIPLSYFLENRPTYYVSDYQLNHPEDFPFDRIPNGKNYQFKTGKHLIPFYDLNEHSLWGFTANLTDHFVEILEENKTK